MHHVTCFLTRLTFTAETADEELVALFLQTGFTCTSDPYSDHVPVHVRAFRDAPCGYVYKLNRCFCFHLSPSRLA
jgi:hypothetical protein